MQVFGGIYFERCWEGDWDQLSGSGLRAAATLASLGASPTLAGYAAREDEPAVRAASSGVGVSQLDLRVIPLTVRFEYEHPLATPIIFPPLQLIVPGDAIRSTTTNALRFGFVDGDAVVHAEAAVYDPQSAYQPAFFHANGSEADRLAVVCNSREAAHLSQKPDINTAIKTIADRDRANVVIVKQGARGARVYSDGSMQHVPAFRTPTVWPIGSGDVFSAAFAKAWAIDGASPVDAVRLASIATAWYCESRTLPTPDFLEDFAPPTVPVGPEEPPLVYLAGPFFNMMQQWAIRQARNALREAGLRVFSPLHDVGHGVADDVATKDLEGLERSAAVFALCDGLDSGTLFEIGYARRIGIPVVAFVQSETEESLKMLQGSGCEVVRDFASAVYRLVWAVYE
jgi:nucleoside 2-deoxyribosyltransferase